MNRIQKIRDNIARNIPQSRVHLNDGPDHRYFNEDTGEIYTSVTTKLRILSNPIFSDRKMNRSMEYILDNFDLNSSITGISGTNERSITKENLGHIIDEAKEYPGKLFKEAGTRGTRAHKYLDKYINEWIKRGIRPNYKDILGSEPDVGQWSAIRSFIKWSHEHKFTPIASELMVWSHKNNLAGTLDCIGLLGNDLAVLDWKTSQVIIKSYYLQLAAYAGMFKELTRLRPKRFMIVKLDLKQGQSHCEEVVDQPNLYKTYLLCSKLYDRMITLNTEINQSKPKLVL